MSSHLALFAAQVVSVFSVLFLGIGFFKSQPASRNARLFLVLCLAITCYLLQGMDNGYIDPAFRLDFGGYIYVIDFGANSIPGLFMLFCYSVFQESSKFPKWLGGAFAVQLFLDQLLIRSYNSGSLGTLNGWVESVIVQMQFIHFTDVLMLLFAGFAVYWTVKDWHHDLVEDRRLLRWVFLGVQGSAIFIIVVLESFFMMDGSENNLPLRMMIVYSIAFILVVQAVLMMRFDSALLASVIRNVAPFSVSARATGSVGNHGGLDMENFNTEFQQHKVHREAGLTIAILAKKMSLPEYRLRALINKQMGYRNFNAMLHEYRIGDASVALADSSQRNTPILTIALTVGYQSITPFNNAFRELQGVTPSEYRKRSLQESKVA